MVVVCVGQEKGYPFRMMNPKHSWIFWDYCKNVMPKDIQSGLKQYHRAPTNLKLLYEALNKYNVDPPKSSEDEHMLAAERWCREKFVPETKLPLRRLDDVLSSDLPSGTSPGYPYKQSGFKTKADAWPQAYADACHILSVYEKGGSCAFPPAMAYCRTKVVDRDEPKIRFIFGVSLQVLILQMIFFEPIWKYQLSGKTPAAYKNTVFYGGYSKLLEEMYECGASVENGNTAIMSDFKNYDTNCGYWLTRRIYKIIEDCLDFDYFEDGYFNDQAHNYRRLFYDLMRHDIETEVIMPDGFLWKKFNGDSTGSRGFQIMQNIRTCYINQSVHHKTYGRLAPFMKSLGDDCIWSDHLEFPFKFDVASKYVEKVFGPKYNVEKSTMTTKNSELAFLGRQFWGRYSTRNLIDCVLSLLYPENERDTFILYAQRVVSLYYENAGGDSRVTNMLKKAFCVIPQHLRKSMELGVVDPGWSFHQLKRFQRIGLEAPPKLKIPSCMHMFLLVTQPKGFMQKCQFERMYEIPIWI